MKTTAYYPYTPEYKYGFDVTRDKWIPFRPERFVYHLTKGHPLQGERESIRYKRWSIVLNGLFGVENGNAGVWANNSMDHFMKLYPIHIDHWGMDIPMILRWLYSFDIWRIDTLAFDARWYIDPNHMLCYPKEMENWVFTENTVPPSALKLFRFGIDDYDFLYGRQLDARFWLEPVKEINNLLDHQRFKQKESIRKKTG